MADKKISELPASAGLDTDDLLAVVEDGVTKKATIADLLDLAPSGNGIPTVINVVTDYGATGDGVTDDRTAIANALSAADGAGGGVVYLPTGTYLVGASGSTGAMLTVESNVTLRGEGPKASIIQSASAVNGHNAIKFATSATDARIEQLGVTATSATSNGACIIATTNTDCAVVDCWIANKYGWGVFIGANSADVSVVRTVIAGSSGNGVEINGSSYCSVESCHISSTTGNNIEFYDASAYRAVGLSAIDNHLASATASGVGCYGTIGAVIQGNRVVNSGSYGIFLEVSEIDAARYSRECVVSGNIVKGADAGNLGTAGIGLTSGARRNTVQGNTVEGSLNASQGIYVDGIGNTISGNVCYLNGGHGILINTTAARTTVAGNTCTDNSGTGVGSANGLEVGATNCKIIGNVGSDTRGGSNRQQFGVYCAGNNSVLVGNGGTGNTNHAVYDSSTGTTRLGNEGIQAIDTYPDLIVNSVTAGTTETLDGDDYNIHDVFLDENVTFTFTTSTVAAQFTLILHQDGTGGNSVTWPASVKWHSDTPPTILTTANAVHVLEFLTIDTGGTWRGFLSSSNTS